MRNQHLALSFLALAGCVLMTAGPAAPNANGAQPNIIINDDLGYRDLGCFGSPDILAPNVDRLARHGR